MDQKMTDVLNILASGDNLSQRDIAKKTGISLGLVNLLIKKCAKKGLLKIERLNSRNIRYIVTPSGIKEMTKKTIDYVKKSYRAIQEIQGKVLEIGLKHKAQGKDIWLLKEKNDEVFELVSNTLKENDIDFNVVDNPVKIKSSNKGDRGTVLYHWDPDLEFKDKEIEIFNIVKC